MMMLEMCRCENVCIIHCLLSSSGYWVSLYWVFSIEYLSLFQLLLNVLYFMLLMVSYKFNVLYVVTILCCSFSYSDILLLFCSLYFVSSDFVCFVQWSPVVSISVCHACSCLCWRVPFKWNESDMFFIHSASMGHSLFNVLYGVSFACYLVNVFLVFHSECFSFTVSKVFYSVCYHDCQCFL